MKIPGGSKVILCIHFQNKISLFGSVRQTPASSSKNGILQIWEISPRNHITVLPCNYNLISCQNLLRMIQLVKPYKEGKQEQVKSWEEQMEARSRWRKKREAVERSEAGEKGNPTHKSRHNTMPLDNRGIMGTIKGYQVTWKNNRKQKGSSI